MHGRGRQLEVIQVLHDGARHTALRAESFQVVIERNIDFAVRVRIVRKHTLVDAEARRQGKPARIIRTGGLRQQAINLERSPEGLIAVIVREHARITLSVIRLGIDPVTPLEIYVLEHGNIALRHRQKASQGTRQYVENAKAPLGRKAVLHINRHMRRKGRKARKKVRVELGNSRPTVSLVEGFAHHDTRCEMSELVQVQGIVKVILEMEIVPLFVPPSLVENEPVGCTVGNQNRRGHAHALGN